MPKTDTLIVMESTDGRSLTPHDQTVADGFVQFAYAILARSEDTEVKLDAVVQLAKVVVDSDLSTISRIEITHGTLVVTVI